MHRRSGHPSQPCDTRHAAKPFQARTSGLDDIRHVVGDVFFIAECGTDRRSPPPPKRLPVTVLGDSCAGAIERLRSYDTQPPPNL